jgi:hypothetical protein
MANAMSSLDVVENVNTSSTFESSSVSGGGGFSVDLFGIVEVGGSVNASGYDSESTSEFARELSEHAQSASRHVGAGVRAASRRSTAAVPRARPSPGTGEAATNFYKEQVYPDGLLLRTQS